MPLGYSRVFVSLDGTPAQNIVLERALRIAIQNNSTLIIGHVINSSPLEAAGTYPADIIPSMKAHFIEEIQYEIDRFAEENQAAPKNIEYCVEVGRIKETLLEDCIEQQEPDLVICGARDLSRLQHILLGSVSSYLVSHVTCDILIVKEAGQVIEEREAEGSTE